MPLLSQRSRFERRIVETLDDGAVFGSIYVKGPIRVERRNFAWRDPVA